MRALLFLFGASMLMAGDWVLRLVRDRKCPIPVYLDCDYSSSNRPGDVKRSFEYAKAALD